MNDHLFGRWNQLAKSFLGEDFLDSMLNIHRNNAEEPKADVYHSRHEVIVVLDLPGIEDIHSLQYQIEKSKVVVLGIIPNPYDGFPAYSQQCKRGEFQKEIDLGAEVDGKKCSIRYRRGVLELRFPKI